MKYIVLLGDGMSDLPNQSGSTPLSTAYKPTIDALALKGLLGTCLTVPRSMKPGSDNANLSVLGYDPLKYYTGRSPLEAASLRIPLKDTDITYRMNLVTLSGLGYESMTMDDYSAGEITTKEADILVKYLSGNLGLPENIRLYSGVSYRHCLVYGQGETGAKLTPPHDISDKVIANYMPSGKNAGVFTALMKKSHELLKDHPVNIARAARGLRPANSAWFWGEGKKAVLPSFYDMYGLRGAVISAVDLLKGIGISAEMAVYEVDGATGNMDTNFEGKAAAALKALDDGLDYVYLHVEAPDECGHRGDRALKTRAIEYLSERVLKPLLEGLDNRKYDYTILITPDHATPTSTKTHTSDPVPFVLYRSNDQMENGKPYDEKNAADGLFVGEGYKLIQLMLKKP